MKRNLIFLTAVFSVFTACKFRATMNDGAELKGEGIIFLVPNETSSSSSGEGGIAYDGETVKAKTDGKQLVVNGVSYGPLSPGDKVDLRTKGKVSVNGAERQPQ